LPFGSSKEAPNALNRGKNMAAVTNPASPSTVIGAQQSNMSFDVVSHAKLGCENGLERYLIKVKFFNNFGSDRTVTFQTESKSLKTAFEMIEVIGQQTNQLNDDDFKKYRNSNLGKRMWFDMTNISNNPRCKEDLVTVYKRDRHGNSLEYVFNSKIKIENKVLQDLKTLARHRQNQVDPSVDLNRRNVQVLLKKKH
jgi:hypothetical protein